MGKKRFCYTASCIAARVSTGGLSAVEVCREALDAAEADTNNAYITVMRELALKTANLVDERVARDEKLPLAGVPISIKDNICTEDVKTTCASKMLADFVPSYSATVYKKILSAGAVPVGKTNMDEFAVGGDGSTSYFGPCKNPLSSERSPGGSSSGSAASLALGSVLLSLGSDTGGSARLPAAYCGLYALKPTYGAVSRYGLVGMAPSLEQICPMAKYLSDCELLFDVIRGFDERDMTTSYYSESMAEIPTTIRVGVVLPADVSIDVRSAMENIASILVNCGATLENTMLPLQEYVSRVYYTISSAETYSNLARFDGIRYGYRSENGNVRQTRSEAFGDTLKERIAEGVYSLTHDGGSPYIRALEYQRDIISGLDNLFEKYDVILMPVSDTVAPIIGDGVVDNDRYNVYANLTGCPALAIPAGMTDAGLPVGIQLMARRGAEKLLFEVAKMIEGGEKLDV